MIVGVGVSVGVAVSVGVGVPNVHVWVKRNEVVAVQPLTMLRTVRGTSVPIAGQIGGGRERLGTLTVNEVPSAAAAVTVATMPAKRASELAIVVGRFVPVMTTEVPPAPETGKMLVMAIGGVM